MSPTSSAFAIITALLEDMHSVAIEGQASGLSKDEGRALADGRLAFAAACSVCEVRFGGPHQWHLERYDEPLSAYPICRRCHHAVHIRFYRPDFWQRFLRELGAKTWVHDLAVTPMRHRP